VSEKTRSAGSPMIVVIALCFGGLSAALTQTMVIPIQPELPTLLGTSASNASWVITVTLLAAAVAMPVTGRLADMFGKQRMLVVNAAMLAVGSAICALSEALVPVLAGRALQGLAMGFIPVGISLVREVVPPKMAATATAAMSATMGVGGAIGLPLAAWIAQEGDWHTLFWVATGMAVLVFLATVFVIPHVHDAQPGSLDVVGIIGLAVGLVAFLLGISKASEWGWDDRQTIGCIVGGVVVLILWGVFELFTSDPLVDLRTTAKPAVLFTNLAAIAIGFGMMAQSIVMPQLLQMKSAIAPYGLDQTLLEAGLWMAPGGLMMMIFAPISGRLIGSIGAKATLMIGATVLGGGYVVAYFMMDAPWQLLVASCVVTAGVGIGYAAMPTLIMNAVPMREAASAVGLNSLMRSLGTTIASAVMVTLLTSQTIGNTPVPAKSGYEWCFVAGAIAAFVGVALVALLPRARKGEKKDAESASDAADGHVVPEFHQTGIEAVAVAGERPILAVVGAGAEMAEVVDRAADIAAEYGARLQVVRVHETQVAVELSAEPGTEPVAEPAEDAKASLRSHLDRLAARSVAADGRVLHSAGDVAAAGRALAAYADEVDARALVLGLSPRGSFFKLLDPELTAAFTRASSRSVLLVPADGSPQVSGRRLAGLQQQG